MRELDLAGNNPVNNVPRLQVFTQKQIVIMGDKLNEITNVHFKLCLYHMRISAYSKVNEFEVCANRRIGRFLMISRKSMHNSSIYDNGDDHNSLIVLIKRW